MNNKKRGIGLWVVVLVCVFIGIIVSEGWNLLTTSDYSYSDFQQDIQTKAEQIEDVVISPFSCGFCSPLSTVSKAAAEIK